MPDVTMPRLSDSMEEGTILAWRKRDGDVVARGDELAEIETDKATMVYEAEDEGVLTITAEAGTTVAVGDVIATIGETSTPSPPAPVASAPSAPVRAKGRAGRAGTGSGAGGVGTVDGGRVKASPVARRLAAELGIDLAGLQGTGPRSRIVKADVLAAAPRPTAEPADTEPPRRPAPVQPAPGSAVELTRVQQRIARRMAESKATIPDFAVAIDVDMTAAVELRERLKAELGGADGAVVPSFNDLVVKACAVTLAEQPRANGSYRDGMIELHDRINVGIAVAAPDALLVPTIDRADERSLGSIARRARELARKVREGTITASDLSGGTFTVSNLGMFGVTSFTAVVNPPQAAILAVGALEGRPAVLGDAVVVAPRMTLTLTCDHRVLYGADAARFVARVKELLEAPLPLAIS